MFHDDLTCKLYSLHLCQILLLSIRQLFVLFRFFFTSEMTRLLPAVDLSGVYDQCSKWAGTLRPVRPSVYDRPNMASVNAS